MSVRNTLAKKTISYICAFLVIFSLFALSFPLLASAANDKEGDTLEAVIAEGDASSEINGLEKVVWNAAKVVYGNSIFSSLDSVLKLDVDNAGNAVNDGGVASGVKIGVWDLMKRAYSVFETIGFLIMLLFFLIELAEKTTYENFSIEHFFRLMVKFVLGTIFILNGFEIMTTLVQFSAGIFDMVKGITGSSTASAPSQSVSALREIKELMESNGALNVFSTMGELLRLTLPWLVMWGCTLYVNVIAYSRLLEIGIMGVFAPIGMADIMTEGTKGNGFRYLRRFLALGIQGAVILAAISLFSVIQSALFNNNTGLQQEMLTCIVAFALVTLIGKSQSIASSLIGA